MKSVMHFEVRGPTHDALIKAATGYYNDCRTTEGKGSSDRKLPDSTEMYIRPIEGPQTSENWNPKVLMWEATVKIEEEIL